jgi:hypothetical protein
MNDYFFVDDFDGINFLEHIFDDIKYGFLQ